MPCMEFPFEEIGLTYVFTQKRRKLMFTIISIMFIGIGIGYLMRNVQMLQKVEKSASLTILLLLFALGVSIGSNRLIVDNLGRFGWQAAVLASLSITGSMLASLMVFHLFSRKERRDEGKFDGCCIFLCRLPDGSSQ